MTRKSALNLGVDREEAIGKDITTLNPKCLLKKVAHTGIMELAEISRRNKKSVPVVVTPLIKDEVLKGAVCKSIFANIQEATSFISRIVKLDSRNGPQDAPKKVRNCKFTFEDVLGTSKAILLAKKRALQAAQGDSNVLITGESGTGKELFAQGIHMAGLRRQGPFVAINCSGIPENLLESELFGYEFGSFTGARKGGKPGKFELSQNGTIFLDEAADMSMGMQAKLLRVIQEREFVRVGGTHTYELDVRIISATNRDLWEMVQCGQFREDLYYRLDVVNIQTPSLRDRTEDIRLLTEFFISNISECINSKVTGVTEQVLDLFTSYAWPGNVRELRNVLEGAMNLNTGALIDEASLPPRFREKIMMAQQGKPVVSNLRVFEFEDIASNEKAVIQHAIEVSNSNKRQAAIMLKMSRATLYNKLKKYGIDTNH
ncbi:MAG: sigma 54-interacting transcriptional regulator [Desulfomonilaceae bacterium]